MKVYCCNTECIKKPKGYNICTALMDAKDCPEIIDQKEKNEDIADEKNS